MDSFKHILSIGYTCNVVSLFLQMRRIGPSYPFDRIATPMWAVHELITNDFNDLLLQENIAHKKLFDTSDKKFWVDQKHNIRFIASNGEDTTLNKCRNEIHRRVVRWREKLEELDTSKEPVLFVRYEETHEYKDWGKRIEDERYVEKHVHEEYHYLKLFSGEIKKRYPNLQFKILFMSKNGEFVDDEHNIVGIDKPECDYREMKIGRKMYDGVMKHSGFLKENLHL